MRQCGVSIVIGCANVLRDPGVEEQDFAGLELRENALEILRLDHPVTSSPMYWSAVRPPLPNVFEMFRAETTLS